MYAALRSLDLRVRTEIPVQTGEPEVRNVLHLAAWRENRRAGVMREGTWVREEEYRIVRDGAFRFRCAEVGTSGACNSYLPDRTLIRDYAADLAVDMTRRAPIGTVHYAGEASGVGYVSNGAPTLALPFALFLATANAPPIRPTDVRRMAPADGTRSTLRLTSARSVLRRSPLASQKRTFKSAEWTLWIDPKRGVIDRAEVREEWRGGADGNERLALRLMETYQQTLNPELTPADFLPEPLPPVRPARPAAPPAKAGDNDPER
jgi:hypothetical protein